MLRLDDLARSKEAYGLLDNQVGFPNAWFKDTLPKALNAARRRLL